jgi:hypothetical protein
MTRPGRNPRFRRLAAAIVRSASNAQPPEEHTMRRTLIGLTLALALAGVGAAPRLTLPNAAQGATPTSLKGHPLVGSWVALTPFGASAETFAADGSFVAGYPVVEQGPMGPAYYSAGIGVWESTGPRSGHFTSVQAITDASGASLGTLTIDGHLDVSEDGQHFVDDSPETTLTYRDAAGAVVTTIMPFQGNGPITPVTGTRMAVGAPGILVGTPVATPAA